MVFRGHPMVRSLHPTTIEVTTDEHLTPKGDCIIGVSAAKGCAQLSEGVKEALRNRHARVSIRISVGGSVFLVTARGDPALELTDPHDIVIRKSEYVSGRTLALGASAAAKDLPRAMVAELKNPSSTGRMDIEVV